MTYSKEYHAEYYRANIDKKRAQRENWAKENPEKVKECARRVAAKRHASGKTVAIRQKWERQNRDYILWNAAKQRSKRMGLEFTIEKSDIVIPENCPVLGMRLNVEERGRMRPDSPSLDKIDPKKGYVPGNVWVISWRANRMKSDASLEELRLFCDGMLSALIQMQKLI